jgi:hypothetical protein
VLKNSAVLRNLLRCRYGCYCAAIDCTSFEHRTSSTGQRSGKDISYVNVDARMMRRGHLADRDRQKRPASSCKFVSHRAPSFPISPCNRSLGWTLSSRFADFSLNNGNVKSLLSSEGAEAHRHRQQVSQPAADPENMFGGQMLSLLCRLYHMAETTFAGQAVGWLEAIRSSSR